jgi:hypothetical protein
MAHRSKNLHVPTAFAGGTHARFPNRHEQLICKWKWWRRWELNPRPLQSNRE